MSSTPPPNIRLTITVTPEVHAAFQRLAKGTGMSLSRAMGEWLGDTLDAVEHTAGMVERARSAPALAIREMQAYAMGLQDEVGDVVRIMREKGADDRRTSGGRASGLTSAAGGSHPPSSNTGGKGQKTSKGAGGQKS